MTIRAAGADRPVMAACCANAGGTYARGDRKGIGDIAKFDINRANRMFARFWRGLRRENARN
jgi:hypothetical protein